MRRSPTRAGLLASALGTTMIGVGPVPALAQDDTQGTAASAPTAKIARVGVSGLLAALQIRKGRHWYTIDRDRTGARGRYVLRDRRSFPMSAPVRVRIRGNGARIKRRIGRLNVFRVAHASWYGPGLYGGHLACGGTLDAGDLGVEGGEQVAVHGGALSF